MAFTYGFYNSLNGDRKYNAFQMSKLFDGIILDGVFESIGQHFAVTASSGMTVNVGTGRAWFNHTWNENDSVMPITLPQSDLNRSRYDAIVIEVGDPNTDRTNAIKVVSGTPAVNPSKPTLNRGPMNNSGVSPDATDTQPPYQHALAYILVQPGVETISATDIQIVVGMDETPFVTGPIETRSIEELFNQWDAQFSVWFTNLKSQLTDNVVTNLQAQIDENRTAIEGIEGKLGSISGVINANETALSTGTIFITAPGYKGTVKGALPCTGGRYNRNAYPALFNAIGNTNGVYANMISNGVANQARAFIYVDPIGNKIHMAYTTATSGGSVMYRRYSSSGILEKELVISSVSKQTSSPMIYAANQMVFISWNDSAYTYNPYASSSNGGDSFSTSGHWTFTWYAGRTKNGLILGGRTQQTSSSTYYKYIAPEITYQLGSSAMDTLYSDSLSKYIYKQITTGSGYYDIERIDPENGFTKTTLHNGLQGRLSKFFFTMNGKDFAFGENAWSIYSMNPNGTSMNYEGTCKWADGNIPDTHSVSIAATNFPDGTPFIVFGSNPYTISPNMVLTKCEINDVGSYSGYLTIMSNGDIISWYSKVLYENVQFKVPNNSDETNVFYIKT